MTPQALTYKIASISLQELSPSYDEKARTGAVYPLNLSTTPLHVTLSGVGWDGRFAPMGKPRFVERLVREFLEVATTPRYATDKDLGVNLKRLGPPYFVLN